MADVLASAQRNLPGAMIVRIDDPKAFMAVFNSFPPASAYSVPDQIVAVTNEASPGVYVLAFNNVPECGGPSLAKVYKVYSTTFRKIMAQLAGI